MYLRKPMNLLNVEYEDGSEQSHLKILNYVNYTPRGTPNCLWGLVRGYSVAPGDELSHQSGDGWRQRSRNVVSHPRHRDKLGIYNLLCGICARSTVD